MLDRYRPIFKCDHDKTEFLYPATVSLPFSHPNPIKTGNPAAALVLSSNPGYHYTIYPNLVSCIPPNLSWPLALFLTALNIKGTVNLGAIFSSLFPSYIIQDSVHQLITSLGWKPDFGCDLLKMFVIANIINAAECIMK